MYNFLNIFEINGSNKIGMQLEESILKPSLNGGFNFDRLNGSQKVPNFMERLHILVTGFAKMTVPSFKNLPRRLSIPTAVFEISIFFLIVSEQHLQLSISIRN